MIDFFELFPFLVIVSVSVTSIYLIFTDRDKGASEGTGKILQRLYFYLVSFVTLIMVGSGSTILIQFVLQELFAENIMSSSTDKVALGTALMVVGIPLWIIHWRLIHQQIQKSSWALSSQIRKIYKFLVLSVAISILAHSSTGIIQFLLNVKDSSWYQVATLLPFTLIWIYHWRINDQTSNSHKKQIIRDIYIYFTSLIGLILAANGVGAILHHIFEYAYQAITNVMIIVEPQNRIFSDSVRDNLSIAVTGIVLWGLHWLVLDNRKHVSRLKSAYLYGWAILGGGVTSLVGILMLVFTCLAFIFGVQNESNDIGPVPGGLTLLIIGVILFGYHRYIIRSPRRNEINNQNGLQVLDYSFCFLSLIISAIGISTLTHLILTAITGTGNEIVSEENRWRVTTAFALSSLFVGGSLWWYTWRYRIPKLFSIKEETKIIFFTGVVGLGILACVPSLASVLFFFIKSILSADTILSATNSSRIPLSILCAAFVIVPYHWLNLRKEKSTLTESSEENVYHQIKNVTVFTPINSEFFIAALEENLGYRVSSVEWADPGSENVLLKEDSTEEIAERIQSSKGEFVVVLPEPGGVRIYSHN